MQNAVVCAGATREWGGGGIAEGKKRKGRRKDKDGVQYNSGFNSRADLTEFSPNFCHLLSQA